MSVNKSISTISHWRQLQKWKMRRLMKLCWLPAPHCKVNLFVLFKRFSLATTIFVNKKIPQALRSYFLIKAQPTYCIVTLPQTQLQADLLIVAKFCVQNNTFWNVRLLIPLWLKKASVGKTFFFLKPAKIHPSHFTVKAFIYTRNLKVTVHKSILDTYSTTYYCIIRKSDCYWFSFVQPKFLFPFYENVMNSCFLWNEDEWMPWWQSHRPIQLAWRGTDAR